jgi:hypothetical protein
LPLEYRHFGLFQVEIKSTQAEMHRLLSVVGIRCFLERISVTCCGAALTVLWKPSAAFLLRNFLGGQQVEE